MGSIIGSQLAHNVLDMEIHCCFRNLQVASDLFIAMAIANEAKHVEFPSRESFLTHTLGQPQGYLRRNMPPAGVDGSDYSEQLILGHTLKDVASRPARSARSISASPSELVKMMMRALENSPRMEMSASVPLMPGRRRSIRVTSGLCCRNSAMASTPFAAWAASSMSGWEPMILASPSRKTG